MRLLNYRVDLAAWLRALATRLDGADPEAKVASYRTAIQAQSREYASLAQLELAQQKQIAALEAGLGEYNARLAEETRLRQEAELEYTRLRNDRDEQGRAPTQPSKIHWPMEPEDGTK